MFPKFLPAAFNGCALTISDSFHELVASIVFGFSVDIASWLKESTLRYFPFHECLVTTNDDALDDVANVEEAILLYKLG